MMTRHFIAVLFVTLCIFCVVEVNAGEKLILVLVDGVRWDYLDDPSLKGFRRIIDGGVKAKYVVPIYPSLSYPNWYSIVTGLYAENHGFVGNHLYDNVTDTFYHMIPEPNSTDEIWWNEAEPIWITAEKNDMSSALYWWGGCEVRIRGHHPTICERQRYGPPTEEEREDFFERIDDIVEMFKPSKRFPKDRLSLALMYYGSTDYAGHHSGPGSKEMKEALLDIDSILDKMQSKLKKAGLQDQVNIMVVSDHGMTSMSGKMPINLKSFAADIKYQVDSGSATMIVPKDGKLDKLYNDLRRSNIKGMEVYKKEDIPERYHIKGSKRMTPLYLISKKGYYIPHIASNSDRPVASHGYDPGEMEDMRTVFVATGPAFKVGYKAEAVNITDLYNVMCKILNLDSLPNNGSWDAVKYILKGNTRQPRPGNSHSVLSSAMSDHHKYHHFVFASLISVMYVLYYFTNL